MPKIHAVPKGSPLPTFGIVTFMRSRSVRRLVTSIRRYYRHANIVIADNGQKLPAPRAILAERSIVEGASVNILPFDCGLSVARNFLLTDTTGDLVLLDDDFEFTAETCIRSLQSVLADDPTIGIVCGNAGMCAPQDFIGEGPKTTPARSPVQVTAAGITYQTCDMADNFLLIRREAIKSGVRWNPALKVGEHCAFFQDVKREGRWKVAAVAGCRVTHHHQDKDTPEYEAHRGRAAEFTKILRELHKSPSIVVLAVGHSGTTIVVRMLQELGWHLGDAKPNVAENRAVQDINKRLLSRRGICPCGSDDLVTPPRSHADLPTACNRCGKAFTMAQPVARHEFVNALRALRQPWVIKDPRFVLTWADWQPAFGLFRPLVLMVERNLERMRRTYAKHKFADFRIYGEDVGTLVKMARFHFGAWGERKMAVRYEQLAAAVELFDLSKHRS